MNATIVDLRYRMRDVLSALDRGEPVTVLHRGKPRAKLVPTNPDGEAPSIRSLPFAGMWRDREEMADPTAYVENLRKPRYADLPAKPPRTTPAKPRRKTQRSPGQDDH